jgi:hypothetical protein
MFTAQALMTIYKGKTVTFSIRWLYSERTLSRTNINEDFRLVPGNKPIILMDGYKIPLNINNKLSYSCYCLSSRVKSTLRALIVNLTTKTKILRETNTTVSTELPIVSSPCLVLA